MGWSEADRKRSKFFERGCIDVFSPLAGWVTAAHDLDSEEIQLNWKSPHPWKKAGLFCVAFSPVSLPPISEVCFDSPEVCIIYNNIYKGRESLGHMVCFSSWETNCFKVFLLSLPVLCCPLIVKHGLVGVGRGCKVVFIGTAQLLLQSRGGTLCALDQVQFCRSPASSAISKLERGAWSPE